MKPWLWLGLAALAVTSVGAAPGDVKMIEVTGEGARYWSRWRGPSGQGQVPAHLGRLLEESPDGRRVPLRYELCDHLPAEPGLGQAGDGQHDAVEFEGAPRAWLHEPLIVG